MVYKTHNNILWFEFLILNNDINLAKIRIILILSNNYI